MPLLLANPGYDPEDDEPWVDNPIYRLLLDSIPEERKVALVEENECPCCQGKGYVKIIHR